MSVTHVQAGESLLVGGVSIEVMSSKPGRVLLNIGNLRRREVAVTVDGTRIVLVDARPGLATVRIEGDGAERVVLHSPDFEPAQSAPLANGSPYPSEPAAADAPVITDDDGEVF